MSSDDLNASSVIHDQDLLYCRPYGGLNDTLVQMEKCRNYAHDHGRALIYDTSYSGLALAFEECFVPLPSFGPKPVAWTEGVKGQLDLIQDVCPAEVAGRIGSFRIDKRPSGKSFIHQTEIPSYFDHGRAHSEKLLVHATFGGGAIGFIFLSHVALTRQLADAVAARLIPLSGSYDAVHIRDTDMSTDLELLDASLPDLLRDRRVLIASDNIQTRNRYSNRLSGCSEVVSVSEIPENEGKPLHKSEDRDLNYLVDLLSDLFALARAERLFITLTDMGRPSGYGMLAEMLRRHPRILENLFCLASPDLKAALFRDGNPADDPEIAIGITERAKAARAEFWVPQTELSKQFEGKCARAEAALALDNERTQRLLAESAPRD